MVGEALCVMFAIARSHTQMCEVVGMGLVEPPIEKLGWLLTSETHLGVWFRVIKCSCVVFVSRICKGRQKNMYAGNHGQDGGREGHGGARAGRWRRRHQWFPKGYRHINGRLLRSW